MAGMEQTRRVEDPDRLARFMSSVLGADSAEQPPRQRLLRIALALAQRRGRL